MATEALGKQDLENIDENEKLIIKKDGDTMSKEIQNCLGQYGKVSVCNYATTQKSLEAFSEGLEYLTQAKSFKYFGDKLGKYMTVIITMNSKNNDKKRKDFIDSLKELFEKNSDQDNATLAICSLSDDLCKTFKLLNSKME